MRLVQGLFIMLLGIVIISGCSRATEDGKKKGIDNNLALARVGDNYITMGKFFKNPAVKNALQVEIRMAIISHEFESRGLSVDQEKVDESWERFVQMSGGTEQAAMKSIRDRGMTKDFVMDQMLMEHKIQEIYLDENPISEEDAKAEFESSLKSNQMMFKSYVPEKAENPETITYEDVREPFYENLLRRRMTTDASAMMDEIMMKYNNQGIIENYVEEDESGGITEIQPKKKTDTIDKSQVRQAPPVIHGDEHDSSDHDEDTNTNPDGSVSPEEESNE